MKPAPAPRGDLENWLADEPVTARREPWVEWASRWTRRHRTAAVAGLILCFCSVIFGLSAYQRAVLDESLAAERVAAVRKARLAEAPELIKVFEREPDRVVSLLKRALSESTDPDERLRLQMALLPFIMRQIDALADALLIAPLETVGIIRDQLQDFRVEVCAKIVEGDDRASAGSGSLHPGGGGAGIVFSR